MQKYFIVITLIILLAVVRINAQVQGGTFFADKSITGFTLDQNDGKREVMIDVHFKKSFDVKPIVLTSLTLMDISGEKFDIPGNSNTTIETSDQKISAVATGISRDGFVLKISVWGKTHVNAVGGSWMAFTE